MIIEKVVVGSLEANCYIVARAEGADSIVIDPGAEAGKIMGRMKAHGLTPAAIVNTHAHVDHMGADLAIRKEAGAEVPLAIHKDDAGALTNAEMNLAAFVGVDAGAPVPDQLLSDGGVVEAGGICLEVVHTPGHTPGGICLLAGKHLFTGDTLFAGGVGRTDLPGGSWKTLMESIREKLLCLDDDIRIYPGHGPESTIGAERRTNAFLA